MSKLALTAEEWERVSEFLSDDLLWLSERDGDQWVGYIEKEGSTENLYIEGASNRHAVAALCLHNQPFGFTGQDVTMLRVAVMLAKAEGAGLASDSLASCLASIADRIEALLPPEDKTNG